MCTEQPTRVCVSVEGQPKSGRSTVISILRVALRRCGAKVLPSDSDDGHRVEIEVPAGGLRRMDQMTVEQGGYLDWDSVETGTEVRPMEKGFHWRHGIFFRREPDGAVSIVGPNIAWRIEEGEWDSIVGSTYAEIVREIIANAKIVAERRRAAQ